MSQENLKTMIMQNFGGVKEVYYRIVQVVNMTRFLSKFGEQQLIIVNYVCGFNQSETGKYFE